MKIICFVHFLCTEFSITELKVQGHVLNFISLY